MGKKVIEIKLHYADVRQIGKGGGCIGGVAEPKIDGNLRFSVRPEEEDLLDPVPDPLEGTFQLNIYGNSAGYRELGRYFLALAELDMSVDPGFHEHFDDLQSHDGRTHVNVIVRKESM